MDALVMAGGMGKRLGPEEKPLTCVGGKPMIERVLLALAGSKNIDRIFVATSPRSKNTAKWISDLKKTQDNIEIIPTKGDGFVNDMVAAIEKARLSGRVLVTMADLPLLTSGLIDRIIKEYRSAGTNALSVHMKLDTFTRLGLRPDTVFHRDQDFVVPCGINILNADRIREEQDDFILILDNEELALNVNTQEDLAICERMLGSGLAKRL